MVVLNNNTYRGRKARIGGLTFEDGKMKFFVGYHECEGKMCKVLVTIDEAREFANRIGNSKRTVKKRLARWVARQLA